jgi:hypothetical protein
MVASPSALPRSTVGGNICVVNKGPEESNELAGCDGGIAPSVNRLTKCNSRGLETMGLEYVSGDKKCGELYIAGE